MTINVRINESLLLNSDTAVGSDKLFTVPPNEEWVILAVGATLVTTATVGTRRVGVELQDDSSNVIIALVCRADQAASETVVYNFAAGLRDQASVANGTLSTSFPESLLLTPGYKIRVYDFDATDVAGDTLSAFLQALKRFR